MAYNAKSGDTLQPYLDQLERRYAEAASPPCRVRVIVDGLDYTKLPPFDNYPNDFNLGESERLTNLNRKLLHKYRGLHKLINDYNWSVAIIKRNEGHLPRLQMDDWHDKTADAKSKLDESIQSIVELIEEVRAVGGDKAYHIPVIFKMVVERALDKRGFRAESGSLMYLSKKPHYISEECKPASNVDLSDTTPSGRSNREQKDRIEKVASHVNRIRYLEACNSDDPVLKDHQHDLRKLFGEVLHHTQAGGLAMEPDLHQAGLTIVSALEEKERVAHERERERLQEFRDQHAALLKRKREEDNMKMVKKFKDSMASYRKKKREQLLADRTLETNTWKVVQAAQKRLECLRVDHLPNEEEKGEKQEFKYPDNFQMGEGRIRTLNNEVLPHFNELSVLVDKHGTAVALEVSLRATDDQRVHRRLKDAVYYYERRVKEVCSRIIEVIGEIDALGGEYYVPPSLFSTLGMPRANYIVEKGSLSFLCGPEEYVPEEYAFPTGVSPDTYRKVKSRYEELAAIVNRLKYYDACFRGDRIVHWPRITELRDRLEHEFPTFPDVVDFTEFPMPKMLRVELWKILSDLKRFNDNMRAVVRSYTG